MKTKHNNNQLAGQATGSGLNSRSDERRSGTANSSTAQAVAVEQAKPARMLPYVNYAEREANRALPTDRILELLRRWMPTQYELAEVVGKWVWITFPEQPAEKVRTELSQLGFHWNNYRKCWQHPCGQFATEGSNEDSRQKDGSRFAADHAAA